MHLVGRHKKICYTTNIHTYNQKEIDTLLEVQSASFQCHSVLCYHATLNFVLLLEDLTE